MFGTIKSSGFQSSRGFAFIAPSSGGSDIFVHCSEIAAPFSEDLKNKQVEFTLEHSDRGRCATDVRIVERG